jgi:hypothetical protein
MEIFHIDRAFFCGCEDGDDAAEGFGCFEEREEVDDESIARMDDESNSEMEAFCCLYCSISIAQLNGDVPASEGH